jgi:hypothetical protein
VIDRIFIFCDISLKLLFSLGVMHRPARFHSLVFIMYALVTINHVMKAEWTDEQKYTIGKKGKFS